MDARTMYPPQKDSPSTFLLGDITATDTTFVVGNADILPQELPFPLTLGIDKTVTETVLVTDIGAGNNQLTVTRYSGSLTWVAGTKVARVFTANDLKTVQDNLSDVIEQSNDNVLQLEASATDISDLQTTVGNASSGLVKGLNDEIARATAAEASEASRASTAEANLDSSKVSKSALPQVLTDWDSAQSATALTVTITRYNANTNITSTYTRTIPLVSDSDVGLMTPEAYSEILDLRTDVNALQQQGGKYIGVSFPTKADLDAYSVPSTVNSGDFTFVLDDETQSDATTRYIYSGTVFNFAYVINYDPIGIATTQEPGLVMGTEVGTDGKIFVESNGTMSLIGWDDLVELVNSKFTFPSGGSSSTYLDGTGSWSSPDISGKMNTVPSATAGDLAIFDNSGQVVDGGEIPLVFNSEASADDAAAQAASAIDDTKVYWVIEV